MLLRPALPGDADRVADVFIAARSEMEYLPARHTNEETRGFIRDIVMRDLEVWVAEESGHVVAFAALGEDMLDHIYVEPARQGRGAGGRLLALAKERRPLGFRLWIFQKNVGARRFYERHGFRVVRETDGRDNEEREPDTLLEWRPAAPPSTA